MENFYKNFQVQLEKFDDFSVYISNSIKDQKEKLREYAKWVYEAAVEEKELLKNEIDVLKGQVEQLTEERDIWQGEAETLAREINASNDIF